MNAQSRGELAHLFLPATVRITQIQLLWRSRRRLRRAGGGCSCGARQDGRPHV